VLQLEQNRMLMVDGAVQTAYQIDTHRSRAPYTQIIEEALKTYHEVRGETGLKGAVVGLGGGIIPEAEKRAGDRVDIIEIDPRIPKIAETFFEFHPGEFQITLDDARNFFNRNQTKYDYIVMDVFAGESSPFHLLSRECFEEMKTGLSPGGLLVMNTIGLFAGEGSEFIRSIYKTLGSSFPYRSVIAVSGRDNFSNYIMLASEKPLSGLIRASKTLLDGEVYLRDDPGLLLTDDFNPADYLEQNVALAWRLAIWKGTYPDLLLD
jgi:predicted membrane-bound spermidine synthase